MTTLLGEAALFVPGCECSFPVAPSGLDRLMSGYRLTQTALWGEQISSPSGPYLSVQNVTYVFIFAIRLLFLLVAHRSVSNDGFSVGPRLFRALFLSPLCVPIQGQSICTDSGPKYKGTL